MNTRRGFIDQNGNFVVREGFSRPVELTHTEMLSQVSYVALNVVNLGYEPTWTHTVITSILVANDGYPERQIELIRQLNRFAAEGLTDRQIGDLFSA